MPSIKLTTKNILRENAIKINAEGSFKKKRRKKRMNMEDIDIET